MDKLIFSAVITLAISAAAPSFAGNSSMGETLFLKHCATCHGVEAMGDGPMAGVLMIKPPNLTELTRKYEGFPTDRVVRRIDGREAIVSHGSPMPVYGDFFEGLKSSVVMDDGEKLSTSKPIADLIAYLEGVQVN